MFYAPITPLSMATRAESVKIQGWQRVSRGEDGQPFPACSAASGWLPSHERQGNGTRGAVTGRAVDADGTTVGSNDLLYHIQAQSGALRFGGMKGSKQERQAVRRNAVPRILHLQVELRAVTPAT